MNTRSLLLSAAALVAFCTTASAITLPPTVQFERVAQPNTTILDSFDPFMFMTDAFGFWTEEFINDTGETISDFHFEWDPPSVTPPSTDGGPFFEETGVTTSTADFACTATIIPGAKCEKPGILDGEGFVITVFGFAPGTMFTATPTKDFDCCDPVPLPASLPLAAGGLAMLAILRRRAWV